MSTISSECLVTSLKLALVGELCSDLFPPLATVFQGRLQAPARLYADERRNLAIFLGDFMPDGLAATAIARTIVAWARDKECALVLTSVGLPLEEDEAQHQVTAVANGPEAAARLRLADIPIAQLAAISGTAGSLLLEGREAGIPVIALLMRTHHDRPDFEAAVKLAEAIGRITPDARCEIEPLREEALGTEQALRRLQAQTPASGIYR